ncbi:tensin-3 isoform X1 [Tachysurus fulvidraco]|uniref:tensin-3 isoform X1 n=1 Tax=Tachysurus fulvidraco TaxID=1234273 RepID=UPI001FEF3514|nr:tensin-3 isoform X1 [Tachysurus fulvidraco]
MEEGYELDLTYVTERIIAVSFPQACSEETYLHNLKDVTRMLKSKHADNYLVINLSEKKHDLTKMNPKTLDTGWPDLHAPPLDKICTICKAMENWLHNDPLHVVVIHCRGGKGRIGVIISSFVHFTDISASADQALDRFAMRKFYDDKVSAMMTPSQKRYVWILNSLLSGSMKMNTSPLFLHCIILHGIPNFDNSGVCRPFIKVYQGMQAVYASGVYHIGPGHRHKVCIALEPAQLLKGDIMVKCFHKSSPSQRDLVFRLQFHTGAVQGYSLMFEKKDMEQANKDPRFPDYGKVELVFSEGPERSQGADIWQNGADVSVDYSSTDSLNRWDSYQDVCNGEAPPLQPPIATLDKLSPKRSQGSTVILSRSNRTISVTSSPEHSDHALSASSDSGLSSASLWTERCLVSGGKTAGPSEQEKADLNRLLSGFGLDKPRTDEGMELTSAPQGVLHHPVQVHINGNSRPKERETDILDDEVLMSGHDLRSVDSLGTLSSSYHKSSQNSLLSDGFCSPGVIEDIPHPGPAAMEEYERAYAETRRNCLAKRSVSVPITTTSNTASKGQQFQQGNYSTQTWVRQQQMVAAPHYSYLPEESAVEENFHGDRQEILLKGIISNQNHAAVNPKISPCQESEKNHDEEFNSLTVDIDNSIDQLNQLILDLDPTFVPIPTQTNSFKRNGGTTTVTTTCNNKGLTLKLNENNRNQQAAVPPARESLRALSRQGSEVTEHSTVFGRPAWDMEPEFRDRLTYTHSVAPPQRAPLSRADSVEYRGPGAGLDTGSDMVPPTPAFPISPPTPYVKSEFTHFSQTPSPSTSMFGAFRMENDMKTFADIMGRDESRVNVSHRAFTHSPSTGGAITLTDGPGQSSCQEGVLLSRKTSINTQHSDPVGYNQNFPPSHHPHMHPHPAPNAHSSPRGIQRTQTVQYTLNRSPALSFDQEPDRLSYEPQQPPLPEKMHLLDCDRSIGSVSPAPSGFSSPHSGSSLSIPFPNSLPELQARSNSISPLPDVLVSKQVTVKFVQDTSKYWYKPDIARDQAIAVLKDKEPGSFIVRDSHSFKGAYGLAMKVATPPPTVVQQSKKGGDLSNELVRHFLIECTPKGVRLKGCPNEPYFGSLTALVCQHSITPLALPCKLIIPDRDPLEDTVEASPQSISNSAAELLKQGAACNVWFLGSVEMESLTGYHAVQKATTDLLSSESVPSSTVVHFKVSSQGITLTDNQRKLFFRRHYAVNTVIFCALDPQDRKWRRDGNPSAKIFGFIARKSGSGMDNVCHLFAEHDPEQPASAIVNFVSKVMIGSQKNA